MNTNDNGTTTTPANTENTIEALPYYRAKWVAKQVLVYKTLDLDLPPEFADPKFTDEDLEEAVHEVDGWATKATKENPEGNPKVYFTARTSKGQTNGNVRDAMILSTAKNIRRGFILATMGVTEEGVKAAMEAIQSGHKATRSARALKALGLPGQPGEKSADVAHKPQPRQFSSATAVPRLTTQGSAPAAPALFNDIKAVLAEAARLRALGLTDEQIVGVMSR